MGFAGPPFMPTCSAYAGLAAPREDEKRANRLARELFRQRESFRSARDASKETLR